MKTFAIILVTFTVAFVMGILSEKQSPAKTADRLETAFRIGYAKGMTHAAHMATGKLRTENDSRKRLEDDLNWFKSK